MKIPRTLIYWSLYTFLASNVNAATKSCLPLSDQRKAELCKYVQRKYRVAEGAGVTISEVEGFGSNCYRRIRFRSDGPPHLDLRLYLTPDQRYLTTELNDSKTDPVADENRRVATLRNEIEDGNAPSRGAVDASVTLTIFSDFQCPFCGQLADTLKQIESDHEFSPQVRVIFRHLPLDVHPWAMSAARLTACLGSTNSTAFWRVHDYLFENQRELTQSTLTARVAEVLSASPSAEIDIMRICLDLKTAPLQLERDIAVAKAQEIRGTPTIFVNGFRVDGAPTREHLLTLIREALRDSAK